ncbi:MAG: hypothetical protein IPP32_12695 [Bacteroidetes bacterium]|nr:hypothetical protein [Bacteroidota bacterium]
MKKIIAILFCFLFYSFLQVRSATDVKWVNISKDEMAQILVRISNWYKNDAYSISIAHNSYNDFSSLSPFEKSFGYVKKNKTNFHSFLLGVHSIQNENVKLVIDSASKQMTLAFADKQLESVFTAEDYILTLNYCTSILQRNLESEKIYRLEFDEKNMVGAYEFKLNKQGLLKSIVIYYNHEILKDESTRKEMEVRPRLEIIFSNYKLNPPFDYKEDFDEKKYISYGSKNKLMLNQAYKYYKLSDQRLLIK